MNEQGNKESLWQTIKKSELAKLLVEVTVGVGLLAIGANVLMGAAV